MINFQKSSNTMSKVLNHTQLTETLELTECTDGFWLYDETQGISLSVKAPTRDAAFIEALEFYQKRLKEVETQHQALMKKVANFVSQFSENETA